MLFFIFPHFLLYLILFGVRGSLMHCCGLIGSLYHNLIITEHGLYSKFLLKYCKKRFTIYNWKQKSRQIELLLYFTSFLSPHIPRYTATGNKKNYSILLKPGQKLYDICWKIVNNLISGNGFKNTLASMGFLPV